MLWTQARARGVGDRRCGKHYKLREMLEDRDVSYVLAVPMNQRIIVKDGALGTERRPDELIASERAYFSFRGGRANGTEMFVGTSLL